MASTRFLTRAAASILPNGSATSGPICANHRNARAATSGVTGPARLRFQRIETASGELSILSAGAGDAVVLIHGLGATKGSFLPTVAALAGSFRLIALDLPGFGASDKPDSDYTLDQFVMWLDAFMAAKDSEVAKALGPGKVVNAMKDKAAGEAASVARHFIQLSG